ncbi:MAG TPA: hypothetical protein EYF95_04080 [Flavobacteriales bacterium]|nr:hypothetical protein [Flavobacteriales bacterium]
MDLPIQFFKLPLIIVSMVGFIGCGISPNHTSSLESDELYLSSGEEFITDAEYLAFALKDFESLDYEEDYYNENSGYINNRGYSNNNFNSNLPYNSLGLSSYFSPYGAGYNNCGFNNYGNNNYNSYGYGGYGYNSYNNYGYGGYGYNPYNCYGQGGYGYNPYNNYGYGGYNGGGYFGSYSGGETYYTSSVLVGPRTPLLTGTLTNSNYRGGRLSTNKTEETGSGVTNSTNVSSENYNVNKTRSIWNWDPRDPSTINNNATRSGDTNISNSRPSSRPSTRNDNNSSHSNKTGRSNNSTGKSGGRRQ